MCYWVRRLVTASIPNRRARRQGDARPDGHQHLNVDHNAWVYQMLCGQRPAGNLGPRLHVTLSWLKVRRRLDYPVLHQGATGFDPDHAPTQRTLRSSSTCTPKPGTRSGESEPKTAAAGTRTTSSTGAYSPGPASDAPYESHEAAAL